MRDNLDVGLENFYGGLTYPRLDPCQRSNSETTQTRNSMQNRNLEANLRLSANLMPKSILKRVSDLVDVKSTRKSITI